MRGEEVWFAILLVIAVSLILAMTSTEGRIEPTPTPTIPALVLELDECVDACVEEHEPGTLEHKECARACFEDYLEVGE